MSQDFAEITLDIFRRAGAVLDGHFLLTSGLHSPTYMEKFLVLQWPKYTERLCRMIAEQHCEADVEVVAGPTTGGVILAYDVARHLGVRGIFAERGSSGGRAFRRGFTVNPGERVLVVDDVLTTGGSVREVVDEVRRLGGNVLGVAVIVDRSASPVDLGAPLSALLRLEIPSYQPASCPLCAQGLPLTKRGTGEA